jgi:hypothetical protein
LKLDKAITIPKLYPISIEWSEEVYRNYDKIGFKLD